MPCSLSANGAVATMNCQKNKGIFNAMLSKMLREMENDGLAVRSEYLEAPIRVKYGLTEKAR